MIKIKIFTALIAAVVLTGIYPVFIHHYFTVFLQTTAETKITAELKYQTSKTEKIITQRKQTDFKGKAFFYLPSEQLYRLELNIEKKAQIRSITINGTQKVNLRRNGKKTFSSPLKGQIKIDWYNGAALFFLFWYLFYFLFTFRKNKKIETYSPTQPKMLNIELLRIIFTLCVVCCHIVIPLKIWTNTRYAVEFFFILSGFFLTLSFNPEKTTMSFMKQKICRFWPLIVFGALINCLFVRHIDGSKLLSDIFLLSNFLYRKDGYNGPAWYVCVLFWITPFYFNLMKTQKKENINLIIALCLVLSLHILIAADFVGGKIRIFRGIAGISTGYFVALAYQQLSVQKPRNGIFFSIAEASLLSYCLISFFYNRIFPADPVFIMIAFAALILLFSLKYGMFSRCLERPIFAQISKYCPAVYLTHGILTQSVMPILINKYAVYLKLHIELTLAAFIAAACILGMLAHYIIENPGRRLMLKLLK